MKDLKLAEQVITCVTGVVLIMAGVLFAIFYTVPQETMQMLPYTLGGIGLFAFVAGLNGVNVIRIKNKNANLAKQINDFDDERSNLIDYKAKATTNGITNILFLALIIFLAVMQVHLVVFWVFIGVFFFRIILSIILVAKYNKEM